MKNLLLTLAVLSFLVYSAFHYFKKNDINLKFSENEKEISISAKFPNEKTPEVQSYLTEELGDSNDTSFRNTNIDGEVGLKDGTFFYMKLAEGRLKIEMERKRNTHNAYKKMKKLAKGLKEVLTSN